MHNLLEMSIYYITRQNRIEASIHKTRTWSLKFRIDRSEILDLQFFCKQNLNHNLYRQDGKSYRHFAYRQVEILIDSFNELSGSVILNLRLWSHEGSLIDAHATYTMITTSYVSFSLTWRPQMQCVDDSWKYFRLVYIYIYRYIYIYIYIFICRSCNESHRRSLWNLIVDVCQSQSFPRIFAARPFNVLK